MSLICFGYWNLNPKEITPRIVANYFVLPEFELLNLVPGDIFKNNVFRLPLIVKRCAGDEVANYSKFTCQQLADWHGCCKNVSK